MNDSPSDAVAGRLDALDEAECRRLLAQRSVGRIAMVLDGVPVILPVNCTVDGQDVVFRTSEHGLLGMAATWGRPVAFQVDSIDENGDAGWSVMVQGELREVLGEEAAELALRVAPAAGGDRPLVGRVVASTTSGRRIGG